MIVVDTNVLVNFWIPSENSGLCTELFKWDPVWVAPALWRSEFRNAVRLYMKKDIIDLNAAMKITERAENQMDKREYHVNSPKVYAYVDKSYCSSYDCEFIALADDLESFLATMDKKILKAFPEIAFHPRDIIKA